jgi:hypothetical protein
MANAQQPNERDGRWDERLKCRVQQLQYDFHTKTGRLDFPEANCCDMTGAVGIFMAIDPEVRVIDTYAGGKADVLYRRGKERGEWKAHLRGE